MRVLPMRTATKIVSVLRRQNLTLISKFQFRNGDLHTSSLVTGYLEKRAVLPPMCSGHEDVFRSLPQLLLEDKFRSDTKELC
jgi:hypothetical protein